MKLKIGVLPAEAKENLGTVLQRMKEGREVTRNINGSVDCRIVRCELPAIEAKLVNDEFIPTGKTTIITKKREYEIDNETGNVAVKTNPLKYLFLSSSKVLKKISSIIDTTKNNFDNSEIVQQYRLAVHCFSPERIKQLQETIAAFQRGEKTK